MAEEALSLRDVTVAYDGRLALDGVSLHIPTGQRVAMVGPSGAGKTTVLRLCTASVQPTAGTVRVLGTDLASTSATELRALRSRVGSIHQQLELVGALRVVHNVNAGRLGQWGTGRAVRSLLRPADVADTRAVLARVGIADKVFERTDRLSGGEQQRVALARALVQDPELLLADEPVSSLDPARAEEVMGLLSSVAGECRRSLLVSLHDFALARRYCDRVIAIRSGRVMFDLDAAEVTDDIGVELYRIAGP
ncbi:MAG: phosphonate ABC transporter ATP-binding protein [Acidimicrobiales bacterium]